MSYESEHVLPKQTKITHVLDLIKLLGFKKHSMPYKYDSSVTSYSWYDNNDYKSWSGVELSVIHEKHKITIYTRSSSSRSYWDLEHQNYTIKKFKDFFGGNFITDEGQNRYFRAPSPPTTPIASGCYLAYWRFRNAFMSLEHYLRFREFETKRINDKSSKIEILNSFNPLLFSNNMILPYLIAIWEDFFKALFIVVLKYSEKKTKS